MGCVFALVAMVPPSSPVVVPIVVLAASYVPTVAARALLARATPCDCIALRCSRPLAVLCVACST
eukprot:2175628-Pyramimonas_sp.AAC.1